MQMSRGGGVIETEREREGSYYSRLVKKGKGRGLKISKNGVWLVWYTGGVGGPEDRNFVETARPGAG